MIAKLDATTPGAREARQMIYNLAAAWLGAGESDEPFKEEVGRAAERIVGPIRADDIPASMEAQAQRVVDAVYAATQVIGALLVADALITAALQGTLDEDSIEAALEQLADVVENIGTDPRREQMRARMAMIENALETLAEDARSGGSPEDH